MLQSFQVVYDNFKVVKNFANGRYAQNCTTTLYNYL
jgi:hypothetical protein